MIAHFHIQEKIGHKRLVAMVNSLRAGTLLRKIGTYHCHINDKWYNDEGTFTIFKESYNDECQRRDLTIDEFLPYLRLYHGKNKNYCLNGIYYDYIQPLLRNLSSAENVKMLRKFTIKDLEECTLTYEEADRKYSLGSGYCCEDCDGCYSQYKRSRYHYNYEKYNVKNASELFIKHLNSLKVGSWQKAPFQLKPES